MNTVKTKEQLSIALMKGSFSPAEARHLITEMIQVKIKFHEAKINKEDDAETIKMRENRIIKLQNDLQKLRAFTHETDSNIFIDADIHFSVGHA